MEDTAVPMYNFINSLLRINLAMLARFKIDYGLKATCYDRVEFVRTFLQNVFTSAMWC